MNVEKCKKNYALNFSLGNKNSASTMTSCGHILTWDEFTYSYNVSLLPTIILWSEELLLLKKHVLHR